MEPDPDEHLHPGEEDLAWTEEQAQLFKDIKPKGQYNVISDAARSVIPTEKLCAFFCGGKKCKYCIGQGWKEEEMVIPGLYSQWVTDKILAMARPSNHGLQKYDQLKEFKKQGIQSILNLQTPGEHADCGPNKLDPSGFSYNPQAFMDEKIFFYNYGWPDYGVASLSKILDMVKVMQFSLSEGKIAVHCHAGRGRTGVIIACYLIFTNRMNWRDAIHYVREKRPGSIQTKAQIQVIEDFEKYLQPFRIVFASRDSSDVPNHRKKGSHEFSLQQFLNRQKLILHGYEARKLKYLPKVVYIVCERLLELAHKGKALTRLHSQTLSTASVQSEPPTLSVSSTLSQTLSTASVQAKPSTLPVSSTPRESYRNRSDDSLCDLNSTLRSPSLALLRNKHRSISMEDLQNEQFKGILYEPDNKSSTSSGGDVVGSVISMESVANNGHDNLSIVNDKFSNNLSIVNHKSSDNISIVSDRSSGSSSSRKKKKKFLRSKRFEIDKSESNDVSLISGSSQDDSLQMPTSSNGGSLSVERVVIGLVGEVSQSALEKATQCEMALNESDSNWNQIVEETDPQVLATILWDWLDQLKEPVLRVQDLRLILKLVDDPNTGLLKVEKGTSCMIQYFVNVFSRLEPIEEDLKIRLLEKILSHLTHQWVVYAYGQTIVDSDAVTSRSLQAEEKDHWSDMRSEHAEKLFIFFLNLMRSSDEESDDTR